MKSIGYARCEGNEVSYTAISGNVARLLVAGKNLIGKEHRIALQVTWDNKPSPQDISECEVIVTNLFKATSVVSKHAPCLTPEDLERFLSGREDSVH